MNSRTYRPAAGSVNKRVQPCPQCEWMLQAITDHNSANNARVLPNCQTPRTHDGRANRAHHSRWSVPRTTLIVACPALASARAACLHAVYSLGRACLIPLSKSINTVPLVPGVIDVGVCRDGEWLTSRTFLPKSALAQPCGAA